MVEDDVPRVLYAVKFSNGWQYAASADEARERGLPVVEYGRRNPVKGEALSDRLGSAAGSGDWPRDTTPHYCAGCGRVGCVSEAKRDADRLRAENETLAALVAGWAGEILNCADRSQLAAAMLDQDAVRRYIDQANAEDDENERLRAALTKIADRNAWSDYERPHRHTRRFAQSALASDEMEATP